MCRQEIEYKENQKENHPEKVTELTTSDWVLGYSVLAVVVGIILFAFGYATAPLWLPDDFVPPSNRHEIVVVGDGLDGERIKEVIKEDVIGQ